jgi:hypothetical protein
LLSCQDGSAVLDAHTDGLTMLPESAGGETVGALYVEGNGTQCSQTPLEIRALEPCIALYELSTGVVRQRPQSQVGDINRPGAPLVCRALRATLVRERAEMPSEVFSYSGGLLARPIGERGSVQIDGCRGRRTILYGRGFPGNLDIRSGLLTWDTGRNVEFYKEGESSNGTVFGYELATRRRHSWKLPRVRVHGGPEPPAVGAFGYSTHTADTIFWIASELLTGPEITGVLTSGVYATPLK